MSFLVFLLLIAGAFAWIVLRPLLAPLVMAILAAVLFHPFHSRIERRLGGPGTITSLLSTLGLNLFVAAPMAAFAAYFVTQLREVLAKGIGIESTDLSSSRFMQLIGAYSEWATRRLAEVLGTQLDIQGAAMNTLRNLGEAIYTSLPGILGSAGLFVLDLIIFNIILYFLFREGPGLVNALVELSPMDDRYDRQILSRLRRMIEAVFMGALLTSLLQGVLGFLGFWFGGISNPLVWGALIGLTGVIPGIGSIVIWAPAAIFQWTDGSHGSAIVIGIFGLAIGLSDSLLRPIFIQGRAAVSPLVIFIGLFGGILTAGPMGLIYGPLLAAAVMEFIRIYRSDFLSSTPPVAAVAPSKPPPAPPPAEPAKGA